MKRFIPVLFATTLLAGCAGGGGTVVEERIDFKRVTQFDGRVLEVEVTPTDGRTLRLNTARDSFVSSSATPDMPNHSGRYWTLLNRTSGNTTIVYALVNWDNDVQTDYLVAGWWLQFEGRPRYPRFPIFTSERGIFVEGTELDTANPPRMPVTGAATYVGASGGLYAYEYGRGWGELAGTEVFEEVQGVITLRADFSSKTIQGCIGCEGDIEIGRSHLRFALGWRQGDPPAAVPTDYEVHLGPTPFTRGGGFRAADVRVTHPGRSVAQSGGSWEGRFSNRPDDEGNPRLVAGSSLAEFTEADGSRGSLEGIFNALSEPFRNSGQSQ
ncbi:MAG: hypothetical protein OXL41_03765 [Nitrospinae bacterium]|nr:hypothetical protein [Nitrospinota bacterium]